MENLLFGCDILSIKDLSLAQIQQILAVSALLKNKNSSLDCCIGHSTFSGTGIQPSALHTIPGRDVLQTWNGQNNSRGHNLSALLSDKIIANCFFEPSTRTRLSFESATLRLGGKTLGFASDEALSIQKGETLHDTIRMIENYADLIVLRHPKEGASRYAAEVSDKPVINAGDGANQHPSQTLVDLFTIFECQNRLDKLAIALVGDLKYGRTIHSFVQSCKLFDIRLFLVAPDVLSLPDTICDALKKDGIRFSHHHSLAEVIPKIDILYMTRIQQERFREAEYQAIKNHFILTRKLLEQAKPNLKILHPLPRVNEIGAEVDLSPHAYYFEQAANGVYVRQALLTLLLKKALP